MNPGPQRGRLDEGLKIDYGALRSDFMEWAKERFDERYFKCMVSYLDRFVKEPIRGSMDIVRVFSGLSEGQKHNLNRGLRNLFNFLEAQGWSRGYLNLLRKNIPKDKTGIDLRVPELNEIIRSLRKSSRIALKYRALWNLCLDSGLRLVEAIGVIKGFEEDRLQRINGICRYEVGAFRSSKQAYYAYMTESTLKLVEKTAGEDLIPQNASHYYRKYGLTAPKYLRKFTFDKMIELEIPESVADFIEGRVPKKIGAKHYMVLRRQADRFYPRYGCYVEELRERAGLH